MLTVRPSEDGDEAAALALSASVFAESRTHYRPRRAPIVEASLPVSLRRYVALDHGQIVGTVQVTTLEDRWHLRALAVAVEHRCRGVARAIIDRLSDEALVAGARCLSLYTIRQTGNIPVFERLGFRVVREELCDALESVDGASLSDVYMERVLGQVHDTA